jgi:hypothetical protein
MSQIRGRLERSMLPSFVEAGDLSCVLGPLIEVRSLRAASALVSQEKVSSFRRDRNRPIRR